MSSIKQITRTPDLFLFPQWDSDITYYANSIVTYLDSDAPRSYIYMAKTVNTNQKPNRTSDFWVEISYDSDHLQVQVDKLFTANYDVFVQRIDSDSAAARTTILADVDSELRETRADVNESLLNFNTRIKSETDSEIAVLRNDLDSEVSSLNAFTALTLSNFQTSFDSDTAALYARVDLTEANVNAIVNNSKIELDSDVLQLKAKDESIDSDIAINLSKINAINAEVATLQTDFSNYQSAQTVALDALQTTIDSNTAITSNIDDRLDTLTLTDVRIYNDIQGNRDRIIVLEGRIDDAITDITNTNNTLNANLQTQINQINTDIESYEDLNDTTHVAIFNDLSDLRTQVNTVNIALGIDSEVLRVNLDSEYVLSEIRKAIQDDMIDSDWVNRQLTPLDSEWILDQIPKHVYNLDSEWVINNHVNVNDSDSVKTLTELIKLDLDMGTF